MSRVTCPTHGSHPAHPAGRRRGRSAVRRRAAALVALCAVGLTGGCTPARPDGTGGSLPSPSAATAARADSGSALVTAPRGTSGAADRAAPPLAGAAPAVVVHLVDGDTLDVVLDGGGRERIRLIGIDTPETKKPDHPIDCFGPEASAHLAELVPEGTRVLLLRDVEPRDDYGRFLAYLFRASDHVFVNLELAEGGYARALRIAPNTAFADDVSRAVAAARDGRRGLWASCGDPGQDGGRK